MRGAVQVAEGDVQPAAAKLSLNKAIDVSLVINATANEDAGKEALQGFQGEIVERDVDLSDIVSAQLTGVGFDIDTRKRSSGRSFRARRSTAGNGA